MIRRRKNHRPDEIVAKLRDATTQSGNTASCALEGGVPNVIASTDSHWIDGTYPGY